MSDKKAKALVLFSGGLDSLLAVKVLQAQNVDVAAVCFYSNFFSCDKAIVGAEAIGVPLITIDIGEEMVSLVKDPPNGFGKNMNPCVDCHSQMFRLAAAVFCKNYVSFEGIPPLREASGRDDKESNLRIHPLREASGRDDKESNRRISPLREASGRDDKESNRRIHPLREASGRDDKESKGIFCSTPQSLPRRFYGASVRDDKNRLQDDIQPSFDIIASGEVLGQRPFSQNKEALARVARLAGVEILRPLSAKLLPETEYERSGLVDRSKLLDISGRTRERQMALAARYGIKEYPSPAGGCLLTDPGFSDRLKQMLEHWPDCDSKDIELLKHGRVFWLKYGGGVGKWALAVIGRHQSDNAELERLAQKGDYVLQLKEIPGPLAVARFKGRKDFKFEDFQLIADETMEFPCLNSHESNSCEAVIKKVAVMTAFYSIKARGNKAEVQIKIV
jgi:hypothetical protein